MPDPIPDFLGTVPLLARAVVVRRGDDPSEGFFIVADGEVAASVLAFVGGDSDIAWKLPKHVDLLLIRDRG